MYLNGKNFIYPQVAEIVKNCIEADNKNFYKLKRKFIENKKVFQFAYSSVYPEVYSFAGKRSVDMRNNFDLKFKERKDRKKIFPKINRGIFFQGTNFIASCRRYSEKAC